MSHSGQPFGTGTDTKMEVDDNSGNSKRPRQILQQAPAVPGPFAEWKGFPVRTTSTAMIPIQRGPFQATPGSANPNTLGGQFLSQSASQMRALQIPAIQPTSSLQAMGSTRRQQVMLPDDKGILRPHHVLPETVAHFHTVVQAEQTMVVKAPVPQPSVSFGSIPSTSSLHSSQASLGSQTSQSLQVSEREFSRMLQQLYQMLSSARSQDNIDRVKLKIHTLLQQHQHQQQFWSPPNPAEDESFSNVAEESFEGNSMLPSHYPSETVTIKRPETSSAGHLLCQRKKGFLSRVNLVLSRFFLSKL